MFRGGESDMSRKNFNRGITAVVFAAALTVAGAQPAAAEGFGWRNAWDWLVGFWATSSTCTGGDCGAEIDPNGRPNAGPEIDPDGSTTQGDCGPEIDPIGRPCPLPPVGPEIDPIG